MMYPRPNCISGRQSYSYIKCGTRTLMLPPTLAHGNCKNKITQTDEARKYSMNMEKSNADTK